MNRTREIERCPKCGYVLEHFMKKTEDVFGCPICKKEISRAKSIKEYEVYCKDCKKWHDIERSCLVNELYNGGLI